MAPAAGGGEPAEARVARVKYLRDRARTALQPTERQPDLSRIRHKRPRSPEEEAGLAKLIDALNAKRMLPLPGAMVIAGDTDGVRWEGSRARLTCSAAHR